MKDERSKTAHFLFILHPSALIFCINQLPKSHDLR
jgi:hypothetical protein